MCNRDGGGVCDRGGSKLGGAVRVSGLTVGRYAEERGEER